MEDKYCKNCKYRNTDLVLWPCTACYPPNFTKFEPSFRWCCKAALKVFKRDIRDLWRIIFNDH